MFDITGLLRLLNSIQQLLLLFLPVAVTFGGETLIEGDRVGFVAGSIEQPVGDVVIDLFNNVFKMRILATDFLLGGLFWHKGEEEH